MKYAIFSTEWGYFGLVSTKKGLLKSQLPAASHEEAKSRLLKNLGPAEYDPHIFKAVQKQIIAYFRGQRADLGKNLALDLGEFSPFGRRVLIACRGVKSGQTISYLQLAKRIKRPNSARAVANILAQNPLPLIIPCHRVVRADGQIGGFSAPGGKSLKKRLLKFEGKFASREL